MSFEELIGYLAPVILTFVVQLLKKIVSFGGYAALAVVFVIGGLTAVVGVGPAGPDPTWVDTTMNAGWIIGLATFIYSLIKSRK
jgi:hypothetical protein